MKKYYSIITMAVIMISALIFNSCGAESESNGGNNNVINGKHLVRFVIRQGSYIDVHDCLYDKEGRPTNYIASNSEDTEIVYYNNSIVELEGSSNTEYFIENGLIVKSKGDKKANYYYDNGYLTRIDDGSSSGTKCYWEKGNLSRIEYDNFVFYKNVVYEFQYSNHPDYNSTIYFLLFNPKTIRGPKEKGSKNLPSALRISIQSENTFTIADCDWEMKDGLPVKLVMSNREDGKIVSTVDFYWE